MSEGFDPTFDASLHTIIPLYQVLMGNEEAIMQMKLEFQTRGWCIVRLPRAEDHTYKWIFSRSPHYEFLLPSSDAFESLYNYFDMPTKNQSKFYSRVQHKESLHILTPLHNDKDLREPPTPHGPPASTLGACVVRWADVLDKLAPALLARIAQPLFGCEDAAALARAADLPSAHGAHVGMLDIAHYINEQTASLSPKIGHSTKEVNCVPHYDPGLLSLSFLSTRDGLQLQDPNTGAWFAGPVNTNEGQKDLGVIWLGDAAVTASGGKLKAGVHRVVYPREAFPRVTVWYELCTQGQVNNESRTDYPAEGSVILRNILESRPISYLKNRFTLNHHIQSEYGLHSSKPLYAPVGDNYLYKN